VPSHFGQKEPNKAAIFCIPEDRIKDTEIREPSVGTGQSLSKLTGVGGCETSKVLRLKVLPCLQALQLRRELPCVFWRGKTLFNRSVQTKEELRRTFCSDDKPSFHHTQQNSRRNFCM
jgi:hypothetical protein